MKNSKRTIKMILSTIIFGLILTISIGLSIWIITDTITVKPNQTDKENSQIVIEYLDGKNATYNGNILLPSDKTVGLDVSSERLTYYYKKENSDGDFTKVDLEKSLGPIDAGNYKIKIEFIINKDEGSIFDAELDFVIEPKDIKDANVFFEGNNDNKFYIGQTYDDFVRDLKVSVILIEDTEPTPLNIDEDFTIAAPVLNTVYTGTIKITGKGNYTGTYDLNYTVVELLQLVVTPLYPDNGNWQILEYNGYAQNPNLKVTDFKTEKEISEYDISCSQEIKNKGDYVVTVTVSKVGYESASVTVQVKITAVELVVNWSNTEFVYDGTEHAPTATLEGVKGEDDIVAIVTNKKTNKGVWEAGLVLAGNNDGNYTISDASTKCGFEISARLLTLSASYFELSYSSSHRKWDSGDTNTSIKSAIADLNIFNNIADPDKGNLKPTIVGMHNNIYAYGNVSVGNLDYSMVNVVGSTYQVTFRVDNSNYVIATSTFILKYKTVLIDKNTSTYYTIEDAFKEATSMIYFCGNSDGEATYVATSFTGLSLDLYENKTTYELNGKQLIVPYKSGTPNSGFSEDNDTSTSGEIKKGNVYSAFIIPEHILINVKGSGGITVAALIDFNMNHYSTAATTRGVLLNNGNIHVESGSIYACGYIKGTGNIVLEKGTSMLESMTIYDWHGGSATSSMYKNVFPVNCWSMRNNLCETTIKAGAVYEGMVYVTASLSSVTMGAAISCEVIGKYSSSKCLFKPKSDSENGEIIKSIIADETNLDMLNTITSYNQERNMNVKDRIEIKKGNYIDAELSMSKTLFFVMTIELSTDTTKPLPISYMDIVIGSEANLNISNSDYLFLPGTKAVVEEGGVITIGNNVDIVFASCKDIFENDNYIDYSTWLVNEDAFLINNGTVIVIGGMGGKLTSEVSGSVLNFSDGAVTSVYKSVNSTASPYYYTSGSIQSIGCINGSDDKPFETKNKYVYNGSFWFKESGTISYVTNGAIESCPKETITIGVSGYTLDSLPVITKTGYEFIGWFLDSTFTKPAEGVIIYDSVTLYAKWEICSYDIIFDTDGGTEIDKITANYNTVIEGPTDPTKDGYIFNGWYDSEGVKISFPINMPIGGLSLTARWISENVKTYTITFDCSGGTVIDTITVEEGTILNSASYVTSKNGYNFVEWQLDGVAYDFSQEVNSDLELVAVWSLVEYSITYETNGGTLSDDSINSYTIESSTVTLPTVTKNGYDFKGWYTSSDFSGSAVSQIEKGSYGNKKLYAKYEAEEYEIKYNLDGGTNNAKNPDTYTVEDEITLSDPTRSGYKFDGWYAGNTKVTKISKGTTGDISLTAKWTQESSGGGCVAAGTLITLADGTQKKVEDLKPDDLLLVFNHETGQYEAASIIFIDDDGWKEYNVLNLVFSDGYSVKVIDVHGFFDLDLNKYVYIDNYNYNEFIGHRFVVTDVINGEYVQREVKLEEVNVTVEYTGCYSPVTVYHLNYFTNNLLSMPGGIEGLFNIFEYGEGIKYDEELMKEDIEKYGLYTYEDFEEYLPYEIYCVFPAPYLKVSVEKGYITFDGILELIDRYLGKMLDYQ